MKLKDLGLTKQDIKDKVSKYMIDTMKMELRIWISMQVSR